ncbi:MAG TPA: ankyrin repeat domain-containing protein [Desulfomonilaceae bacterium]|nr:ankyrin repeat domain-containing protein [Desulfomonilaceae bacterium]
MKKYTGKFRFFREARIAGCCAVTIFMFTTLTTHVFAAGSDDSLLDAVARGELHRVELLVKKGGDVNAKRAGEGTTALMLASKEGHERIVDFLLRSGADANGRNIHGWTPLMAAAANGHAEIVKLLLEHGSDVNAKHAYGWTAFKLASQKKHDRVKELLLKHGAKK